MSRAKKEGGELHLLLARKEIKRNKANPVCECAVAGNANLDPQKPGHFSVLQNQRFYSQVCWLVSSSVA